MNEKETKEITQSVLKKYNERNGKQLYLRTPETLPRDPNELLKLVREMCPLVSGVHVPRQKSAKFCLIDFASKEERSQGLKEFRAKIKSGKLIKHVVRIPRTENAAFLQKIAERKVQNVMKKRLKTQLRGAMKRKRKEEEQEERGRIIRSSILRLEQLPPTIGLHQLRNLFPDAIDIQLQRNHHQHHRYHRMGPVAALTFPTPAHALSAYREEHLLDRVKLKKSFVTNSARRRNNFLKNFKEFQKLMKEEEKIKIEVKEEEEVVEEVVEEMVEEEEEPSMDNKECSSAYVTTSEEEET